MGAVRIRALRTRPQPWGCRLPKGNLRFRRNGKYEGNQQYETDFVKQGDTDDKARQANGPLNIFTTEDIVSVVAIR